MHLPRYGWLRKPATQVVPNKKAQQSQRTCLGKGRRVK